MSSTAVITNTSGPQASGGLCTCCITCGEISTCNQWCATNLRAFIRGPDCDCPCPDRRDFPPSHRLIWSFTVATGTFATTPGFNDDFPTYRAEASPATGTAEIIFNTNGGASCIVNAGVVHVTQTLIAPDGTDGAAYEFDISPVFGYALSPCGALIAFSVNIWQVSGSPSSSGINPVADAIGSLGSRCDVGSTAGSVYDRLISSVGALTWEPTCRDCDDQLIFYEADPASTCSDVIRIRLQAWDSDGSTYVTLDSAGAGGFDTFTYNVVARTEERDGEKCCPSRNPLDCDECDNPRGSDCEECWSIEASTPYGQLHFWGRGSCPSNFTWHDGGEDDAHPPAIIEIEFDTECPEEGDI